MTTIRGIYLVVAQRQVSAGNLTLAIVSLWDETPLIKLISESTYSSVTVGAEPKEIIIEVNQWHLVVVTRLY